MVKCNHQTRARPYFQVLKIFSILMRKVWITTLEEFEECVGAYLRLCGPLLPLFFLTIVISAIWNELSVYELSGAQNNNNFIIHHTE